MSDSYSSLTVVLEHPIRGEYIENVIHAIKQLRWVADVTAQPMEGFDYIAKTQAKLELQAKCYDALREVFKRDDQGF